MLITYPTPEELAVLTYRSKKEIAGQVRIVTIPGADVCACCGTHTVATGQVGQIKILRELQGRCPAQRRLRRTRPAGSAGHAEPSGRHRRTALG